MIFSTIQSCQPIEKGWSGDRKFCVVTVNGEKYLLRISSMNQLERRKEQFRRMQQVSALGIPMCQPIEFGVCEDGVYILQSWIDGEDAEVLIPTMPKKKQYTYGLDAGRILAKIHSICATANLPDWETRFNAKIDRKIAMYRQCPLKYEGGEVMISFIEAHRHLLSHRPQCYQHGDYHIGNMMLTQEGMLTVIDFEKDDYGDPWEEFNRIVWSAQAAPDFARGMVDGYFGGTVPMEFWQLLALYICNNSIGSLPWAISYGEREIEVMHHQNAQILLWYDYMRNVVPTWYVRK